MRLASELIPVLAARGESVCTVESLTGGLLCAHLTAVPGASLCVSGGVVAYMTAVKHEVVGVDAGLLQRHGAVSAETAVELARNGRRMFGSTWAVATTGVAGPTEQEGKPVGTVYVGVAGPQSIGLVHMQLSGDRVRIREQTCAAGIALLRGMLEYTGDLVSLG